jgi:DNA-binding HxlR family transcriptional regulator
MALDPTCPVCRTAEVVCGKWTLLLVRGLAEGHSRFCELERTLTGISPRTLSLRLRALEAEGMVRRRSHPEVPPRVEYALTDKGLALLPIIEDMRAYGERWLGAGTGCSTETVEALAEAGDGDVRAAPEPSAKARSKGRAGARARLAAAA